jgi:LPXTG-motif cell wall-anchored protein
VEIEILLKLLQSKEKTKVSEKNNNANLWIGLFAVLVAGIIIYLKIK